MRTQDRTVWFNGKPVFVLPDQFYNAADVVGVTVTEDIPCEVIESNINNPNPIKPCLESEN